MMRLSNINGRNNRPIKSSESILPTREGESNFHMKQTDFDWLRQEVNRMIEESIVAVAQS